MNEHESPFDESLISAYLDGELSDQETSEVENAIRSSPALQKLVKDLTTARSLVSASVVKSETLTRSLQSSEWTTAQPATIVSSSERSVESTRSGSASGSGSGSNRPRLSLGLLASLAAVVLIFITAKSLIDSQPDIGPQIVMNGSAFGPGSGPVSPTPLQSESIDPNELSPFSDPLGPVADATISIESTSLQAIQFFAYLENRLNANNGPEAAPWRFVIRDNLNPRTESSLAIQNADGQLRAASSDTPKAKEIAVEFGPSTEEVVLSLTPDEAKAIVMLAKNEQEPNDEFITASELLAIATSPPVASPVASAEPERQEWTIEFSSQLTSDVPLVTGGIDTPNNTAMGEIAASGMGADYGGQLNDQPQSKQSQIPGGPGGDAGPGGYASSKLSGQKAATLAETPRPSSANSPQLNRGRVSKTPPTEKSTDTKAESASPNGDVDRVQSGEKLMRIRIKIKKEPSSSGSNE